MLGQGDEPTLMAQLDACLTGDQEVVGPILVGPATFCCEIDYEIVSMAILFYPLSRPLWLSWMCL